MTRRPDPRLHAYRPDLADRRLEGQVEAERFVEGGIRQVVSGLAPLRRAPRNDAPLDTEALFGEHVRVFEETDEGWAWGQLVADDYVGWIPASCLAPVGDRPTHRVTALRTHVFPEANIKSPPVLALAMNAQIAVRGRSGRFAETDAGFIAMRHLTPAAEAMPDWVATAARFVGTPYLWGGRSSLGLDCSALVQLALHAACGACPRDSDMQFSRLGVAIDHADPATLTRGDLLFWNGHVAIVFGEGLLLHANGFHMETVIEPLIPAIARIAAEGSPVTGARRLPFDQ